MDKTTIDILEDIELDQTILIEALPGMGHVGKLVADTIIEETNAKKFAEIHSNTFPPQVLTNKDGLVEIMNNELYYLKEYGENKQNLIFLTGNTQCVSSEGQYELCLMILDELKKHNIKQIYALGGLATGHNVENPSVFGASTTEKGLKKLKGHEVELKSTDGGIIGASGIFLALGALKKIESLCLMGETSGYFIDPDAAKVVLNVLSNLLNIEISTKSLDEKAKETKEMISKAEKMEQEMINNKPIGSHDDDLRYIG